MIDPRRAALALADIRLVGNSIRHNPSVVVHLPGTTVFIRPGENAPFPSSSASRTFVYDTTAGDLAMILDQARRAYDGAGVAHWFPHIGPGARPDEVERLMRSLGARRWPHVRYPVMARRTGNVKPVQTSLEVRRVGAPEIEAHLADIGPLFDSPDGPRTFLNAASHPAFAHVLAFEPGLPDKPRRAVATGMLTVCGDAGWLGAGITHPDFRRRGGQSALIAERLRIAQERGCEFCVSETSTRDETSLRNLQRAGFALAFEWQVFEVGSAPA